MNRSQVTVLALAVAMLVALAAQAQQDGGGRRGERRGPGGPGGPGAGIGLLMNDKVQAELKLTDDQKEKLRGLGREMRENREDTEKKLAEILTPEQMSRLKELRLQVGGVAVLTTPEVAKELALTDDQLSKLKELQQESMAGMREAYQGMRDLSQDARQAKMTEMREKMEKSRQETLKKAMEVLTPEQREKLEKMKGAKVDIEMFRPQGPRARAGAER